MKKKFILQLKRRFYWEDVLTFYDEKQASLYKLQLINQGLNVRLVEVIYI